MSLSDIILGLLLLYILYRIVMPILTAIYAVLFRSDERTYKAKVITKLEHILRQYASEWMTLDDDRKESAVLYVNMAYKKDKELLDNLKRKPDANCFALYALSLAVQAGSFVGKEDQAYAHCYTLATAMKAFIPTYLQEHEKKQYNKIDEELLNYAHEVVKAMDEALRKAPVVSQMNTWASANV